MGAIVIRLRNANRLPLDDRVDIHVVSTSTDTTVSVARDVAGAAPIKIERLIERQTYLVKVFPLRHRPVAQFVTAGSDDEPGQVQIYAPLHPEHVRTATFPNYADVHQDLRRVLERSTIEGVSGPALYAALTDTQKAGLFNLFAKMRALALETDLQASAAASLTSGGDAALPGSGSTTTSSANLQASALGRTIWSFVDKLFGIRGDRIFIDVESTLHQMMSGAILTGQFRAVSGSLHDPPVGCGHAGSFKSGDRHGNLQLTFFSTLEEPRTFKVDADIDDAAGLGHAFQVLRNFVTQEATHPYDIHQILVFRQEARLPYELA